MQLVTLEGVGCRFHGFALLPPGTRSLLDVGSGTGDAALELAERLGPEALVVGIDRRLEAVEEAQRKARNVALNVRFAVGDAHSLPFDDGSFDVVRADCVFQELDRPLPAVRELARVLRPHGWLLLSDREDVVRGERGVGRAFERAGLTALEVVERGGYGLTLRGRKLEATWSVASNGRL
jgi:ubiquinone/menaquinone biosynthesis C-methylase UbiE